MTFDLEELVVDPANAIAPHLPTPPWFARHRDDEQRLGALGDEHDRVRAVRLCLPAGCRLSERKLVDSDDLDSDGFVRAAQPTPGDRDVPGPRTASARRQAGPSLADLLQQ